MNTPGIGPESIMESHSLSSTNKTSQTTKEKPFSHSSTSSSSPKAFCSPRFRSLSSLAFTFAIAILQTYLITHRLRLLYELNSLESSPKRAYASSLGHLGDLKLANSLIINAALVSVALLFALLHLVTNPLQLSIYSHDGFKLGAHFSSESRLSENSGPVDEVSRFVKLFKWLRVKQTPTACVDLGRSKLWTELPPLGACFHLVSALFLLLAEVQLSSKRIQMSQKPVGDIFATELDFLLGEPIYRLQSSFRLSAENKNFVSEIMQAKDDFSIFTSSSSSSGLNEFGPKSSSNAIGLDYLNFLVALHVFAVNIAQTFWQTSRQFSTLAYIFALNCAVLLSVSYCSFEILFKANNLQKIAKQLLYMRVSSSPNGVDKQIESTINMIEDYGHDIVSAILYLTSSFILLLNCYLVTKFGYKYYFKVRFSSS